MIYFKTIVEEGTISKAAKTLHMAQPPLSIQLKQLEEELGDFNKAWTSKNRIDSSWKSPL